MTGQIGPFQIGVGQIGGSSGYMHFQTIGKPIVTTMDANPSGIGQFIIGVSPIGGFDFLGYFLSLVTSEHFDQPDFMAFLTMLLNPIVADLQLAYSLPTLFDIDTALGEQLDYIGQWVGRTRFLKTPIVGLYFTYDTGPGYNKGIYKGPFDPVSGLTALPDAQYRTYLKAVAVANVWDGTRDGEYDAYDKLFQGQPYQVVIIDYQDMSISLVLAGSLPDPLTLALFTGGYFSLKSEGVRIRDYVYSANPAAPIFAYDVTTNPNFAGYNSGAYAVHVSA